MKMSWTLMMIQMQMKARKKATAEDADKIAFISALLDEFSIRNRR